MADAGVVATDDRMRELSKRLDNVYKEAYNTAIENNQKAIDKLVKLKNEIDTAPKYSHLTQDQKDKKLEANRCFAFCRCVPVRRADWRGLCLLIPAKPRSHGLQRI